MEKKLFGRIPYIWIFRSVWACLLLGVFTFAGLFVYVANTKMPDTQDMENPEFEQSSIVYSDDLVEIDRYFRKNRQWVKYEELSPNLINALIATEDHRFYNHSGIDAYGTARAVAHLGRNGGGSTITQQLAKQFFTIEPSSNIFKRIWQKMKEWVIAVEFERRYTKEELIAMFLNKFEFLNQGHGVGSAANVYFGKRQEDLTVPEAAVFIGMLKNPNYFNPIRRPENTLRSRNVVLSQMRKNGYINNQQYQDFKQEDMDMSHFHQGEVYDGMAPYFMAELKKHIKQILVKKSIVKPGGESYDLDTDGLEIHTTIDTRYQRHAEAAMTKHMIAQQKTFERVWKNRDPWTYINPTDELTSAQKKNQRRIRDAHLSHEVEKTDIYRNMRYKFLNDIIEAIKAKEPDARLWEGDVARLAKAEKDKSYLDGLIDIDYISEDQQKVYLEILKLPEYAKLKAANKKFKNAVTKVMNQPRKMTLFSYKGPIERTMTPIDSIKYMNMFLQLGSVSIEPQTGYVRTWVGGTDYNLWKFDHVTSSRQVGSTFKPFLYTAALNNGISPCQKVRDMQYTIPANDSNFDLNKAWEPGNSRDKFTDEEITLKDALKESLNSASVWLVKQLESVVPIIDVAEGMGIEKGKIPPYPAIVLGAPELSVLEMTGAYTSYANNGTSTKPIFINKIMHEGVIIYKSTIEQSRAIKEDVNYAMVDLLKHAASSRAYALKTTFGGKTGTTNKHVDGWFMGITPNLVTGTWVGGDQQWIRFLSLNEGQGGQMAQPFFIDFMRRVESDPMIGFDTEAQFSIPQSGTLITTDCSLYEPLYDREEELKDEFEEELEIIEGDEL
ncbi:MAG: penicillin-binding protein 1A [Saprospiraceae bacterium]|jgi:penicillin-binding protein 1A